MPELDPIRVSYYLRVKNAGDLLNANIVSKIAKRETYYVSDKSKPFLLPSGSVLGGATENSFVWGAGLMHPKLGLGTAKAKNIHLLRGKKSYEALELSGLKLGDIPLGDPLFLAPKLLNIQRSILPTHRVGVMPHYADRQRPYIQKLLKHPDVVDINVHNDPTRMIEQMAQCDYILSSCLHGIILADALEIPSRWITTDTHFAGEHFEFSDWFSLCRDPQIKPWVLSEADRLEDIVSGCKRNMPDIDMADLEASFPHHQIDCLTETGLSAPIVPLKRCRTSPVPVFVISFNRGRMLQNLVNSLQKLSKDTDVVIHDNGSDDPHAVRALDKLSHDGVKVLRRPKIADATELNNVDESVTDYFKNWAEPQNYVVTDCDISVAPCDANLLEVFGEMLNRFPSIGCACPMLQIHDISKNNPIYNQILTSHIAQFWGKYPCFAELSEGIAAYQPATIDTTFALHRGGEKFERLKKGIRTYEPYEARHLDWYEEEQEENYKQSSNSRISHCGNQTFIDKVKKVALPYDHFIRVERLADQSLCVCKVSVNGTVPQSEQIYSKKIVQQETQITKLEGQLVEAKRRQKAKRLLLRKKVAQLSKEKQEAQSRIAQVQQSVSWRLTIPLRKIATFIRR